jgi:protein-S-isoprenylcysteine O-methyltransferase Ste14
MFKRLANEERTSSEVSPALTWPRVVKGVACLVAFALVWFWIAGRATWVQGWAFLLAFVGYGVTFTWRMARVAPDLLRERSRMAANVERWDKVVMNCYSGLLVVLLTLSALDSGRFRWSAVPIWVQLLGWGALCVTATTIWHVMAINAYLSSWVRIQKDRGQVVITEGLYRYVRHPMYLGIIIGFIGVPLALGSYWALIPAWLIVGVFVYRTAREDRTLMQGLPGYKEYVEQVRYRLFPGIW